eukprot:765832-Hanusia_phi.AAC.2
MLKYAYKHSQAEISSHNNITTSQHILMIMREQGLAVFLSPRLLQSQHTLHLSLSLISTLHSLLRPL